jgi:hypothetical protein
LCDKILIGSSAIKHHFPDFNREPKDIDYAVRVKRGRKDNIEYLENPVLFEFCDQEICPPDILYTLKISHLFWNIGLDKHLFDVQFLKKKGCQINWELFYKLYDYWTLVHGKNKRSDLLMSSEKFFDNRIIFPVPHDDIHEILIKHPYFKGQAKPTYTKILVGEVEVSEELFNILTHAEKCNLVIEEVCVMSTERMFHSDYRVNYHRMLKKFLLNHAPLWEGVFMNWIELHKPPFDYITYLNSNLCQAKT